MRYGTLPAGGYPKRVLNRKRAGAPIREPRPSCAVSASPRLSWNPLPYWRGTVEAQEQRNLAVEVGHPLHNDWGYQVQEHDHHHDHGKNRYAAYSGACGIPGARRVASHKRAHVSTAQRYTGPANASVLLASTAKKNAKGASFLPSHPIPADRGYGQKRRARRGKKR